MKVYVVMKDIINGHDYKDPEFVAYTILVDVFSTLTGARNFIDSYELSEYDTHEGEYTFDHIGLSMAYQNKFVSSDPLKTVTIGLYIIEKEVKE